VLSWFRAYASRLGAVVLLSLAATGATELSHHPLDCHFGCVTGAVEHDAAAHRFSPAQPGTHEHPLHCLACHWARSFRPPAPAAVLPASALEADVRLPFERFAVAHATLAAQPPLRSPPSLT
jgi:hypothetical protein